MGNRVTRAATHLSEEAVYARMQREPRLWRRKLWKISYQALTAPRKAEEIARTVGVSVSTVHRVLAAYQREGGAAIETPGKGGRRHQDLTLEHEHAFLQPFVARAAQGEKVTVAEIHHAFEEQVGHLVDDSTIYRLLNRQGWRHHGGGVKASSASAPAASEHTCTRGRSDRASAEEAVIFSKADPQTVIPMVPQRPDHPGVGHPGTLDPASQRRRAPANNGHARGPQCHMLGRSHRMPMASVAARLPYMVHRLELFPHLATRVIRSKTSPSRRRTIDFLCLQTETSWCTIRSRHQHPHACCERFLRSVRQECLDHLLILHERQLQRVLNAYVIYFNQARPHQGIQQQIPDRSGSSRATAQAGTKVLAVPILAELHHDYRKVA